MVKGAANTTLLRSAALASYDGEYWKVADDADHQMYGGDEIPPRVEGFSSSGRDTITVTPIVEFTPGFIPTSLYTTAVLAGSPLDYYPTQLSFFTEAPLASSYEFSTTHYVFAASSLRVGQVVIHENWLELPGAITDRTRDLAMQIVGDSQTPYDKAEAIETHLRSSYEYDVSYEMAPENHEPVDWFLFEEGRGICLNFNSAFVVLARSVGVPARLVTGFAITPQSEEQEVSARQAHAWAEVPFEEYGWITFDATPPGSVPQTTDSIRKTGTPTTTEITEASPVAQKGRSYIVKGTVVADDGEPVEGVYIEVFLNETKEHGGTLIGEGQVSAGAFNVECNLGNEIEVGPYQLIAHARGDSRYAESWSDPEVSVISASVITLAVPLQVNIGETVVIGGKLSEELGDPIPDQEIGVSIEGVGPPRRLLTDSEGQFSFNQVFARTGTFTIAAAFEGTEYYFESSATAGIDVMMPTAIALDVTGEALVDEPVSIGGRLNDTRNEGVAGKDVVILIDGQRVATITTDVDGVFRFARSFPSEGSHEVEVRFAGVDYYLPSSATASIDILDIVIDVATPGTLIRNEEVLISGGIRTRSGAFPNEPVVILFDGQVLAELETDGEGQFELTHSVSPSTGLGPHSLEYRAPQLGRTRTQEIWVKARTFLEVLVPDEATPGSTLSVKTTLLDKQGGPVVYANVYTMDYQVAGVTDDAGQADLTLSIAAETEVANLSFEFFFAGNELYLPASTAVEVPLVRRGQFPWWMLSLIPVVGVVGVGGYLLHKRNRQRKTPPAAVVTEAVPEMIPADPEKDVGKLETSVAVEFPLIAEPFPDIWGAGDSLDIVCTLTDQNGQALESRLVALVIEGSAFQLTLGEDGRASVAHTFESKGEYTVTCAFDGDNTYVASQTSRELWVVDYREEIVALFASLRERARNRGAMIHSDSTPRDIEAAILRDLPGIDQAMLANIVGCFEEADYSTHDIGRGQYEEAFLALLAMTTPDGGQDDQGT